MFYPSAIELQIKIAECEKQYFAQGLPVVYKLIDNYDPAMDKRLEQMGYEKVTPTYVMNMDLRDRNFLSGDCAITNHADDDWLNAYFSFSKYADSLIKTTTAKQIIENVKNTIWPSSILNAQFSQSQESDSDAYGVELMKRHKFNLPAAESALRKLAEMDGTASGSSSSMFSSHPGSKQRADKVHTLIAAK
jgi:hypothetical protein